MVLVTPQGYRVHGVKWLLMEVLLGVRQCDRHTQWAPIGMIGVAFECKWKFWFKSSSLSGHCCPFCTLNKTISKNRLNRGAREMSSEFCLTDISWSCGTCFCFPSPVVLCCLIYLGSDNSACSSRCPLICYAEDDLELPVPASVSPVLEFQVYLPLWFLWCYVWKLRASCARYFRLWLRSYNLFPQNCYWQLLYYSERNWVFVNW